MCPIIFGLILCRSFTRSLVCSYIPALLLRTYNYYKQFINKYLLLVFLSGFPLWLVTSSSICQMLVIPKKKNQPANSTKRNEEKSTKPPVGIRLTAKEGNIYLFFMSFFVLFLANTVFIFEINKEKKWTDKEE